MAVHRAAGMQFVQKFTIKDDEFNDISELSPARLGDLDFQIGQYLAHQDYKLRQHDHRAPPGLGVRDVTDHNSSD